MKRVPVYPWRRAMILLFTVSVLLTAPVHAAFTYDEGVSGDIDYDTDFNFFTFELGSNTITGHTFFTDVADDFDVFEFDLAPGTEVISITYAFSNVNPAGSGGFGLGMVSFIADLGEWEINVIDDISPVSILDEILPLSDEISYFFNYYLWLHDLGGPVGGSWDYTLTFEVGEATVIPVPAAVWLFASGLLGLVGIARRNITA